MRLYILILTARVDRSEFENVTEPLSKIMGFEVELLPPLFAVAFVDICKL